MKKRHGILLTMCLLFVFVGLAQAAPQAPVLTAAVDNFDATLSWPAVDGATGYSVCHALHPAGAPIVCDDVGNVTTAAAALKEGDSYFVAVRAYDDTGNSRYSNVEVVTIASQATTPGTRALDHMTYISEEIGIRLAGSDEEMAARNYIVNELLALGMSVNTPAFPYQSGDAFGMSYNVVAVLPGASSQEVIVGAHYDSVNVGEGYSDNASGVGALLAAAEALMGQTPPYTVRFIAFGSEENGLKGSRAYASEMSAQDVVNTIAMINLDTIVGGDKIYVYGGADDAGWIRDQALNIATTMDIPFETNPGLNPDYPAGTTGDWSDHAPFKGLGIPYAYFESTNWEIGDLDGYVQTELHGEIWHTENDTREFFDREFPGRVEEQMDGMTKVLNELLMTIDPPPAPETPEPRVKSRGVSFTKRNGASF